jgi:hypothetical protein
MEEVLMDRPADGVAGIGLNRLETKNTLSMVRFDSAGQKEGMRVFREKRKPTYQAK